MYSRGQVYAGLLLLPFLLLFVGDVQVPIGASKITLPIAIFIITPPLLLQAASKKMMLPSLPEKLLIGILLCGGIGVLVTPMAQTGRAAAGALPIIYAVMSLNFYGRNNVSPHDAIRYMLIGGGILAAMIVILSIASFGITDNYYDLKFFIETPLGKSNYLSAFLIFLVALSLASNKILTLLFSLAVFCTLSRGGILMLLFLPLAIYLTRRRRLWILSIISLMAFFAILLLVCTDNIKYLQLLLNHENIWLQSVYNRIDLWVFGIDVWTSQPFFGVGPNTFRTFIESSNMIEDVWGVHNSIILMLMNYGIIGTILYSIYLRLIYKSICAAEFIDNRFLYLRSAFLLLLIFSLFEPLVGSAAFELLLALLLVISKATENQKTSNPLAIGSSTFIHVG